MTKLTLQDLKDMQPDTIFADGIARHPQMPKVPVKWLAVRGGIHDWAIYYGTPDQSLEWIRTSGMKCHSDNAIRHLVPCDEEAFNMYRH